MATLWGVTQDIRLGFWLFLHNGTNRVIPFSIENVVGTTVVAGVATNAKK